MKRTRFPTQKNAAILMGALIASSMSLVGLTDETVQQAAEEDWPAALDEVIVTAQKRDETVQSVPIAVTVLTQDSLTTNRVSTVADLSGLAPNVSVTAAPGGAQIPSFTIRGITSYGVVPGSDKQTSVYLDGVYIGSSRGNIFQLPDIAQLEVLRGPQGTLFGRNATAGAINITTRDPVGEFGFQQDLERGGRNHSRSRTTIDSPTWGPLSGYISYVKEDRDGDIKNLAAGTTWDRTSLGRGIDSVDDTAGKVDTESYFLAARLEATENLFLVYKYELATDHGNPAGNTLSFGTGIDSVIAQTPSLAELISGTDTSRPDAVWNGYNIDRDQKNEGHSLTATWELTDELTLRDILAHRRMFNFQPSGISGLDGVPAGGGSYFCFICSNPYSNSGQWSDELQAIYSADTITLTVGALYYESDDFTGGPPGSGELNVFTYFPSGPNGLIVSPTPATSNSTDGKSYAFYAQGEFEVAPDVELVLGGRITRDRKDGHSIIKNADPALDRDIRTVYTKTKPNYMVGVNYTGFVDTLLYAKFSTAFVSGGSTYGLEYDPEEATSYELGMKADYFDHRLRSNVALFNVTYENYQTVQTGTGVPGYEFAGVLVVPLGDDVVAKGVEVELSGLPIRDLDLTLTLGFAYQDVEYKGYNDIMFRSVQGNDFPGSTVKPIIAAPWSANGSVNYQTKPLFGTAFLNFSLSGNWHDKSRMDANPARANSRAETKAFEYRPEGAVFNARVALQDIDLGNDFTGEIALWGKNILDSDNFNFATQFNGIGMSPTYEEARLYGLTLSLKY